MNISFVSSRFSFQRFASMVATAGLAGLGMLVIAPACTNANGDESGGEPTFDAAAAPAAETGPLGTGTAFTDLYNDFFGPSGAAKCAGTGACHGAATQAGATASGGYVCPPDPSMKEVCRNTMMQFILVDPNSRMSTCGQPFSKSYMYTVLRKTTHGPTDENNMPLSPTYTFTDDSVARIDKWTQAGCPDN